MDALDELIREAQDKVRALQTELIAAEAELAAFEKAAALRPAGGKKRGGRGGGKPKGAISKPWKDTLAELYEHGKAYSYSEIQDCYQHVNDTGLAIASVRDRVRALIDNDFMRGEPGTGFEVTDLAATKFGFPKRAQDSVPSIPSAPTPEEVWRAENEFEPDWDFNDEPDF